MTSPLTASVTQPDALMHYNPLVFSTQADLLDVVGMLYIGGLPQNYTTKRIGPVKDA